MALQRHFNIRVFDQDGSTFRANLTAGRVPSDGSIFVRGTPSFSTRINGGQGELVLDLACRFDEFAGDATKPD